MSSSPQGVLVDMLPISMVMIAYNEADHIYDVIVEYYEEIFKKLPKGSEFIVYLDKPTDGTTGVVKELSQKYTLRVSEGEVNLGYAGALKAAFSLAKNDVIFYSDSSGKHRARDFWQLFPYISRYDIVSGWRKQRSDPIIRRIITVCQRVLVSVLFGLPMHDYNTGFKCIHRRVLNSVLHDCKYTKQSFSTELCVRAMMKGYSIISVPVVFRNRQNSSTGTNYSQLPGIIFRSLLALVLLWKELKGSTYKEN